MCAFLKLLTFPNNVLTQSLNLPWCILFNILNVDYAKPSVKGVIYVKYISLECEGLSGLNFFGREYLPIFGLVYNGSEENVDNGEVFFDKEEQVF